MVALVSSVMVDVSYLLTETSAPVFSMVADINVSFIEKVAPVSS